MKYQLKKISVKELYQLDETTFLDYLALKNMLLVNDDKFLNHEATPMTQLTFGEVGTIKSNLKTVTLDSILEIFQIIYSISDKEFFEADVVTYFYALKYIEKEIVSLIDKERKILSSIPDPIMEMAGSKRLQGFGESSTLINLGRSFGKSPEEIEQWKYGLVFMILAYDKVSGEVQKEYQQIKGKKVG